MAGPISPNDIADAKLKYIPEGVFDAFNEMIIEKFNGDTARVELRDVRRRIILKVPEYDGQVVTDQFVFERGWLDIEAVYERNGWSSVKFIKAAYDENFNSYYEFRK